ncbi:hypothetical protein [Maritimibacter sp. UBA3975]|uniref:hypothetical protein n=1 Tax=Maritimibacter sp. UBA3975 TaxID=1946833 RepID=UPI000C0A5252|nr:hypothetical protein [Maritimibacter sp. UBA3975]MAM61524.1 hypothetical protein [Maritimibacter sp.]|tara:strand:+ start:3392 stop:4267 length:876 start_codon:yes stop_codon:yes gene_type:complete
MQIAFHIGAHCTDEDQLVKSLVKNTQVFTEQGVAVPGPSRYRQLLTDVSVKLAGKPASLETQDMVLEQILDGTDPDRLVFSFDNFISGPRRVLEDGMLYPAAPEKTRVLHNLFPDHDVEFFLSVRNPATFVPAFLKKYADLNRDEIMSKLNPQGMVWSDVIRDIREENPDCPVTIWCNEDTPLIWPEVMHEITAIDMRILFKGGLDILAQIMKREGVKRLRAYMAENQPTSEIQRRRVLSAFLDKYAIDDAVEEEITLPGWTNELVEELSSSYDDDMLELSRIPGVTMITA